MLSRLTLKSSSVALINTLESESQSDLGAHDAAGEALAATGTYLSPLPIVEYGRYHSRQEPGAVVRHAGIRGGGAP